LNRFLLVGVVGFLCHTGLAQAQTEAPATKPPVVALLAAVGDQVDVVRLRASTGSNIEPFRRRSMPVNGQALNYAVLRGLNRAIAEEEPQAQRVLLRWTAPPETAKALADSANKSREAIVQEALLHYLRTLPERAQWDRIEAIVPSYFFSEIKGMGRKLTGIGIYVQPLANTRFDFDENGEMSEAVGQSAELSAGDGDGGHRTLDPNTGAVGRSATFIAPYMYFQRITLDARTLEVIGRKRQFDNTKYADPNATALDVSDQMPVKQMFEKLLQVVERSAYQSVRGARSEVNVTVPVPVPADSAPR